MKKAAIKKLAEPSIIFDQVKFPRGFEARIGIGTFLTSQFDCTCDNHHCLTTTISTYLLKSLDMISAKFDQPIAILMAYNCSKPEHAKGKSIRLSSSANDQLLALFERMYPEFEYEVDDRSILVKQIK